MLGLWFIVTHRQCIWSLFHCEKEIERKFRKFWPCQSKTIHALKLDKIALAKIMLVIYKCPSINILAKGDNCVYSAIHVKWMMLSRERKSERMREKRYASIAKQTTTHTIHIYLMIWIGSMPIFLTYFLWINTRIDILFAELRDI